MAGRVASCCCGQLSIEVQGEPASVGVCHCLACQKRTGSVFAALAGFAPPFTVRGRASEFLRTGEAGAQFIFRFCPICGSTVFHTEAGYEERGVSVAVGCFADPDFPPPRASVYTRRKHRWVRLPADARVFDGDPP